MNQERDMSSSKQIQMIGKTGYSKSSTIEACGSKEHAMVAATLSPSFPKKVWFDDEVTMNLIV